MVDDNPVTRQDVGMYFGPRVLLGILLSISLYLFLSLLVCLFALGVSLNDVEAAAEKPEGFEDTFFGAAFAALPVLVAILAVVVLMEVVGRRLRPRRRSVITIPELVFGSLGYAFINPFYGLTAIWDNKRSNDLTGILWLVSKTYSVFHFCWALALIAYIAIGLVFAAN